MSPLGIYLLLTFICIYLPTYSNSISRPLGLASLSSRYAGLGIFCCRRMLGLHSQNALIDILHYQNRTVLVR
uniref:Secreted protein n=1 Tax=Pararge aegeria TaxID=116150 RepID=S4NHL8_9NEOP